MKENKKKDRSGADTSGRNIRYPNVGHCSQLKPELKVSSCFGLGATQAAYWKGPDCFV
jgi:hypothetical protein